MIAYYINTTKEAKALYCSKCDDILYRNFKLQDNYLDTSDIGKRQSRVCYEECFGLINPKINDNLLVILRSEKKQNQLFDKFLFNLNKLKRCEELSDGWSGENSKTIDSNILSKAKYLIGILAIQPDIYPTPRGTIQFEYYKNNNYLEFEIFPTGTKMLKVINNEPYETILHHSFDINKEVNAFYES